MPRRSPGAHLQLPSTVRRQSRSSRARYRVGGLLHKRAKVHHLVGPWGFLGCVANRNPTLPENRRNDRRKPLARFGAMGSALRERLAPQSYTTNRDTTRIAAWRLVRPFKLHMAVRVYREGPAPKARGRSAASGSEPRQASKSVLRAYVR